MEEEQVCPKPEIKIKSKSLSKTSIKPLNEIIFISERGTDKLLPNLVAIEHVGEKAFGLSCLPKLWTLPFLVVSHELYSKYGECNPENRQQLLIKWSNKIVEAASVIGLQKEDAVIIRSSGCLEGLEKRGQFFSLDGTISKFCNMLDKYFAHFLSDENLTKQKIPFIVQKYLKPISIKGHLSNERRCYEEGRDWLGEIEGEKRNSPFKINLRNWRKKINVNEYLEKQLSCDLSAHISQTLKIPASWAYEGGVRIHFEWIWDGKNIFIVQADKEQAQNGVDPTRLNKSREFFPFHYSPIFLKEITEEHAKKFKKIQNVFLYKKLGLTTIPIYILDDQDVINKIGSSGKIPNELKSDIQELVKGSLVIREDISTTDKNRSQLLPRTDELRDCNIAINWLISESKKKTKNQFADEMIFIFHNFIPAEASAFVCAEPGLRKVQIEALWGLPEGLYYNSHDKYIVDTHAQKIDDIENKTAKFSIAPKYSYKHFFFAPDESGHWTSQILKPPFDWKGTIKQKECIQYIALHSRRIAEMEKESLSIMWFLNVSLGPTMIQAVPWYHEYYDPKKIDQSPTYRKKTIFDKTLIIRTNKDIQELQDETNKAKSLLRRVRIQLQEEKLLRDKNTLKKIGEMCQQIGAIIILEGGVLSHAYYQLLETKAMVEVLHPFVESEDRREFNKLVRDKVPKNIEIGGEIVNKARLSSEHFLQALKEKLIEESCEVLDSIDQDSIITELADVSEIIDSILVQLGASRDDLQVKQKQKRDKAGGFKEGVVLIDTHNPSPLQRKKTDIGDLFNISNENEDSDFLPINDREIIERGHKISKWKDKRDYKSTSEILLRLTVPIVLDKWSALASKAAIDLLSKKGTQIKISGTRVGAKLQIELSICSETKQLQLPFNSQE